MAQTAVSPTGIGNTPLPPGMTIGNIPPTNQQYQNVQNQAGKPNGFNRGNVTGPTNGGTPQQTTPSPGITWGSGPIWNGRPLPQSDNYIFLNNGGYDGGTVIIGAAPAPVIGGYTVNGYGSSASGYSANQSYSTNNGYYSSSGSISTTYFGTPILTSTYGANCYPSPWGYQGLPTYIACPPSAITVYTTPPQAIYIGGYVPYIAPQPQPSVTNVYNQYNQYNYYGSSSTDNAASAPAVTPGSGAGSTRNDATGQTNATKSPVSQAMPTASDADAAIVAQAFQDIARCWMRSDTSLLKKYLVQTQKVAIQSKGAYQYSIEADKFAKVTDDVFDQLVTRSFAFDALRAQANGDVTAYAKHVYMLRSGDDTAPLKTMYAAYTVGKRDGRWVVVAVDSSATPLIAAQGTTSTSSSSARVMTNTAN
jgi:hypothetical protein